MAGRRTGDNKNIYIYLFTKQVAQNNKTQNTGNKKTTIT